MRHATRGTLCGVTMLLCGAAVLGAQQPDTARTATLTGLVRDSAGVPIPNAEVMLGALKFGAYTNAQGWFTLTGAPPGAYELRVERLGYASVIFHWQAQAGDRTEIAITLHAVAHRLDSVVVEGRTPHNAQGKAVLAGVVTDATGAPLPGADVRVIGSGLHALSGADGGFLFSGLAKGSYLLRARRVGFAPVTVSLLIGDGAGNSVAVRMTPLGVQLDTVKVLAKSGFGKNASAWEDFDSRLRWSRASTRSFTLVGSQLAPLGKLPLDLALRYTGAAALGVLPGAETPSITRIATELPSNMIVDPQAGGGSKGAGSTESHRNADREPEGTATVPTGTSPSTAIHDSLSSCILVNGTQPEYEPLRAFTASELEAVEVYAWVTPMADAAPESDITHSIEARMSSIPACASDIEGGHPTYFVVWLKGSS